MAGNSGAIEIQGAYTKINIDIGSLRKDLNDAHKAFNDFQKKTNGTGSGSGLTKDMQNATKAVQAFGAFGKQSFGMMGLAVQSATGFVSAMIPVVVSAGGAIAVATGGITLLTAGLALLTFGAVKTTESLYNTAKGAEGFEKAMSAALMQAKRFGINLDEFTAGIDRATASSRVFSRIQVTEFFGAMARTGSSVKTTEGMLRLFEQNLKSLPGVTVSASHALDNLTTFLMTNQVQLLNEIGLGDEVIATLESKADAVIQKTGQMSQGVDKTTKIIIGMASAMADTAKMSDVMGDALAENEMVMGKIFEDIKTEIGLSLKPMFTALQQAVMPYLFALRDALMRIDWKRFAQAAATAINWVASVIKAGIGFIMRYLSMIPGFNKVVDAFKNITKSTSETVDTTERLKKTVQNTDLSKPIKGMSDEAQKAQKKMAETAKQMADEMYNYNKQLANIADRHQDNLDKARESLQGETEEFNKAYDEMRANFNENMREMSEEHADKTADIIADRAKEVADFEKAEAKKRKDFNRTLEEEKKENSRRLRDLKRQLEKELSQGGGYNEGTVKQLKDAISEQEQLLNDQLEEKKTRFEEDLQDDREKHNEKLSEIDKRLAEENEKYDESVDKAEARYEKDLQNLKENYAEKRVELEKTIAEEEAFFRKHAETLKTIDRSRILDEVEELKRSHAEKLADAQASASEIQGIASGAAVNMDAIWSELKLDELFAQDMQDMGLSLEGFKKSAIKEFDSFAGYLIDTIFNKIGEKFKNTFAGMQNSLMNFVIGAIASTSPLGTVIFTAWKNGWFDKIPQAVNGMWSELQRVVNLAFSGISSFGSNFRSALSNVLNSWIGSLEKTFKSVKLDMPFGNSFKPFDYIYLPRFFKDGGMPSGGSTNGSYVNFMNENGRKEGIQLPTGSMIFSYEDTKTLVNSLKQKMSDVKNEIPNLLSAMGVSGNYDISVDGAGGGRGTFNQINNNTINYPIDMKQLSRELMFEAKSRGVL